MPANKICSSPSGPGNGFDNQIQTQDPTGSASSKPSAASAERPDASDFSSPLDVSTVSTVSLVADAPSRPESFSREKLGDGAFEAFPSGFRVAGGAHASGNGYAPGPGPAASGLEVRAPGASAGLPWTRRVGAAGKAGLLQGTSDY